MLLGAVEYPDDREIAHISGVRCYCPHCGTGHSTLKRRRDEAILRSGHTSKGRPGNLTVMDAAKAAGASEVNFSSVTVSAGWCILSRQEFGVTADQVMAMAKNGHQWHIDQIIKEFEEIACR